MFIISSFFRLGVWAWLVGSLLKDFTKLKSSGTMATFSPGGLTRGGSISRFLQVVSRVHFLEAVEFMAASFFKGARESVCCFQCLISGKAQI